MDVSNGPTPVIAGGEVTAAALGQSIRHGLLQLQEQQQQLPPGRYLPSSASPANLQQLNTGGGSRLGFGFDDDDVGMSLASTPAAVRIGSMAATAAGVGEGAGAGGSESGLDPVAIEGVMQQLRVRAGREGGRGWVTGTVFAPSGRKGGRGWVTGTVFAPSGREGVQAQVLPGQGGERGGTGVAPCISLHHPVCHTSPSHLSHWCESGAQGVGR